MKKQELFNNATGKFPYQRQPGQMGLYDAAYEHDACGVGMLVNIHGEKSHDIVESALKVLENMRHRGADKFDKVFICYEKGFLKATSGCFHSNYTPASCTEIRGLIQNNAIHSCVIILKLPQHSPSIENAAVAKVDKFSD